MRDESLTEVVLHQVYLKRVRGTVFSTMTIEVPATSYMAAAFKALEQMPGWDLVIKILGQ